jgi:hypothetical protein
MRGFFAIHVKFRPPTSWKPHPARLSFVFNADIVDRVDLITQ